jgi:hypothetical protein
LLAFRVHRLLGSRTASFMLIPLIYALHLIYLP